MPSPALHAPADARTLIAARGGRVTRTRVAALDTLQQADGPLSHDEVGERLDTAGIAHDRVTLYRALEWLVEQGLVRRIAGSDRAWRFEALRSADHRHAHFHCERCGQVLCLEDPSPTPVPRLPAGFALGHIEVVVHGACATCGGQHFEEPTR